MDLEKYIRTMKEAYHKAYTTYEEARMNYDLAYENLDSNVSQEKMVVQREELDDKYKAEVEKIKADLQAVVDGQSAAFKGEVSAFYAPDGSKIDLNEMNLIDSGLQLSTANIWDKVVKYADNVTMLQIFQKYVVENRILLDGDTGNEISAVFRRISMNGKGELNALKSFMQLAGAGVNHLGVESSDVYHAVLNKLDEYELQAQIRILEARPVVDEDIQKEIASRDAEITRLQEARGMKKNPRLNWRQML